MNVRMPVLDGIGASEDIIEYDADATTVICSGNRQDEKLKAAVAAGAVDYLTKPFQRAGFLEVVTSHLK
ncbi:two-component system, chemotaxis family, response regulator CheY [Halovenus aranensis]|uniref:Two-component system, chemotaxis family, response regulator CheY n=1 Tax=Halovenus aranensis TaxID=890420 RepID=A0A1G8XJJ0_9EURY|nr:two-component system, chemotaxis family, response regulator CheY [Halovenus aranensis]